MNTVPLVLGLNLNFSLENRRKTFCNPLLASLCVCQFRTRNIIRVNNKLIGIISRQVNMTEFKGWHYYKIFWAFSLSSIFLTLAAYWRGQLGEEFFLFLLVLISFCNIAVDWYFRLFVLRCPFCDGYLFIPFWSGRSFYFGNFAFTGICPSCKKQVKPGPVSAEGYKKIIIGIVVLWIILYILAILKGVRIEHAPCVAPASWSP